MLSKACLVGAYQRKLEELAAEPDIDLTVIVPPYWKDERGVLPLEREHTAGYRLEVLPMALNGSFHLHFYPGLGRLLRALEPDIVHIDEEPYNFATYHANRLARRMGAHTLWFSWQNLRRTYPWPFSAFERYNLRHAEHALVGSATAAEVWRYKGYAGPLSVIPQFGVDPQLFAPPTAPRAASPVVIGYAGRLVPEKGVDLLIAALAELAGPWRLELYGSGPERPRLLALVREAGLQTRVTFHPSVPSLAMPGIYRSLDVLVLPSRSRPNWTEQFGRVLIEAMACGVAVVGAETGEIPHVLGEAGLTFPEDDVAALRAALARLMEAPPLRAELGSRGRGRVLAHFTQERIAAETAAVYRGLKR